MCASIPPELVELIHRSLDLEPELWETSDRAPFCDWAYNPMLSMHIDFRQGVHALNITHTEMRYGRIENWTAGLPGTWRHKIVQRIKNAHARAYKEYLYGQLGREQAKLELRNAGKPPGLPKKVKLESVNKPMTPGLNQGALVGAQVLRRMTMVPGDHSYDALAYAAEVQSKASAVEQQMRQAAAGKKIRELWK